MPAARAAALPADLDDDETVEAAGLPASQPIRAQQAQLLAFLQALEADKGGPRTQVGRRIAGLSARGDKDRAQETRGLCSPLPGCLV